MRIMIPYCGKVSYLFIKHLIFHHCVIMQLTCKVIWTQGYQLHNHSQLLYPAVRQAAVAYYHVMARYINDLLMTAQTDS